MMSLDDDVLAADKRRESHFFIENYQIRKEEPLLDLAATFSPTATQSATSAGSPAGYTPNTTDFALVSQAPDYVRPNASLMFGSFRAIKPSDANRTEALTANVKFIRRLDPSTNLDQLMGRLASFFICDDEDDQPTLTAFVKSIELVNIAAAELRSEFPRATASSDSEGGIQVYWNNRPKDRMVHLLIPSDAGDVRIYRRHAATHSIDHGTNPGLLTESLRWLIS